MVLSGTARVTSKVKSLKRSLLTHIGVVRHDHVLEEAIHRCPACLSIEKPGWKNAYRKTFGSEFVWRGHTKDLNLIIKYGSRGCKGCQLIMTVCCDPSLRIGEPYMVMIDAGYSTWAFRFHVGVQQDKCIGQGLPTRCVEVFSPLQPPIAASWWLTY